MILNNLKKRIYSSIFLILLVILMSQYTFFLLYSLVILGTLSLIEFFNLANRIFKIRFYSILLSTTFTIYILAFSILFFYFSQFIQLKIIIYILLLCCISSDIGGFIFGKIFKGKKLTKISPKKTVSGAIGSLVLGAITVFLLFNFFLKEFHIQSILVGLITSLACQVGDLFFSFLKRKAKLKDTGNFLPGHGGILDRLDGIYLGIPIGMISITLIF